MAIQFYSNDQINKDKWDESIRESASPLIYAESVYLDHMCAGWGALMDEETSAVMPLPLKKKFGITYAYQPPFCQQLGIFSSGRISEDTIHRFLRRAMGEVRVADLYLNYSNDQAALPQRCNYILRLDNPFESIRLGFRKDLIAKPVTQKVRFDEANIPEVFNLYRDFVYPKVRNLPDDQFGRFRMLADYYEQSDDRAFARKVVSTKGTLLSAALFLRDQNRIYYVLSANTSDGRHASSNAFLLYETIREFSGKSLIFDFEGSELPGVKSFFEKFAPDNQPYFHFIADRTGGFLRKGKKLLDRLK